jgi:hypothetical protein
MLSRIRLRPRRPEDFAPLRCSLGYALHSDEDVAKCLAVEGPGDCWKTAPTWRVPVPQPQVRPALEPVASATIAGEAAVEPRDEVVAGESQQVAVRTSEVVVELAHLRIGTGNGTGEDG